MPRDEKAILQLDGLIWQECLNISFDVSKALRGLCVKLMLYTMATLSHTHI